MKKKIADIGISQRLILFNEKKDLAYPKKKDADTTDKKIETHKEDTTNSIVKASKEWKIERPIKNNYIQESRKIEVLEKTRTQTAENAKERLQKGEVYQTPNGKKFIFDEQALKASLHRNESRKFKTQKEVNESIKNLDLAQEAYENVSLNSIQSAQHRVDILSRIKQVMSTEIGLKRFSVIGKQPDLDLYSENVIDGDEALLKSFGAMQNDVEKLFRSAGLPTTTKELLNGGFDYKKINDAIVKSELNSHTSLNTTINKFPDQISIGILPKETLENIGLLSSENRIIFKRGDKDAKRGLTHLWRNHKDMILDPQEASKILSETIGNKSVQTAITMTKNPIKDIVERLILFNEKKGSYCVLDKMGDHFEIVSFHRAEIGYGESQWRKIQK